MPLENVLERQEVSATPRLPVCHIIKGCAVEGPGTVYGAGAGRFEAPEFRLTDLIWSRLEPCPASDVPVAEIIDFLHETGLAIARDSKGYLAQALDHLTVTASLGRGLLEKLFAELPRHFDARAIRGTVEAELGGTDVLDGWREVGLAGGTAGRIRACPPRMVHVLAGNAPVVASLTVIRSAVTKGVSLLKLPSNDLFTAPAILRIMADLSPDHPVVKSFSAVYWRGGDEKVESALFRAQYFDKLVAWGGDAAIRGSIRYVAPGFELVSFDPKNSISMIGHEAFASPEALAEAAAAAAADATYYNQEACSSARIQYVEGDREEADRFCAALLPELGIERDMNTATGAALSEKLRDEISALRYLEPEYKVWGEFDGRGIVIRSDRPVDFYPEGRVVNVVAVDKLEAALRWVNVSTQTVGIHPPRRKRELREHLAQAGVQIVQTLGNGNNHAIGIPHDGLFPLHRFVRWVGDKD